MREIVFDYDDITDEDIQLETLLSLKERYPDFKVTIFAIPAKCSKELLEKLASYDWIELVPHGWNHESRWEAQEWSEKEVNKVLDKIETMGVFKKGFKAPGWKISETLCKVLKKRGYWLCNHMEYIPVEGLKVFSTSFPGYIHTHAHNRGVTNYIEDVAARIEPFGPDDKFFFMSEKVE